MAFCSFSRSQSCIAVTRRVTAVEDMSTWTGLRYQALRLTSRFRSMRDALAGFWSPAFRVMSATVCQTRSVLTGPSMVLDEMMIDRPFALGELVVGRKRVLRQRSGISRVALR